MTPNSSDINRNLLVAPPPQILSIADGATVRFSQHEVEANAAWIVRDRPDIFDVNLGKRVKIAAGEYRIFRSPQIDSCQARQASTGQLIRTIPPGEIICLRTTAKETKRINAYCFVMSGG